jgi:CubicO group peptidase (beta-lactamase class C family)
MRHMAEIHGEVAPGFEGVRDAFAKNFDEGEIGASFSAYHRGAKVVDLWGGVADVESGRPWEEDTMAVVFSTTKGITAICANKLAQDGKLDVEAPVTEYWPEFAAAGKQSMPVSYLLSHQAGLAWLEGEWTPEQVWAWDPVAEALAQQAPHWEPGTAHGYHATTYGWLVGEVIRRVTGKRVGTYFRDDVAEVLGDTDFWIGLPASEEPRVATLAGGLSELGGELDPEVRAMIDQFIGPDTVLGKALFSPGGVFSRADIWNDPAFHAAEVPAAGGIGEARAIARLYGACVSEVDGVRLLSPDQVKQAATQRTSGPNTVLLNLDIQFGLGFMVPSTLLSFGGANSFGHFGAGGSVGWGDPDAELGFGYVMNKMDMGLAGDMRSTRLFNACYDAVR